MAQNVVNLMNNRLRNMCVYHDLRCMQCSEQWFTEADLYWVQLQQPP